MAVKSRKVYLRQGGSLTQETQVLHDERDAEQEIKQER